MVLSRKQDKKTMIDCYIFTLGSALYGAVYDVEDIFRLRCSYRVVGNLVGAIPGYPSQTELTASPLLLSPEEVTLLLQKSTLHVCV